MSQMDLFARQLRDCGMERAAAAERQEDPIFADRASAAIRHIATCQPTVHVDDILPFGLKPQHPNAWGAVWMRAIREGVLERTGTIRPCLTDAGKHKHQYPVYRSLIFR